MRLPREDQRVVGLRIDLAPDTMATILRVIEEGWVLAQGMDATATAKEVPLTKKLREGMRMASSRPDNMIVLPGTESTSTPELEAPDGLTDIPLLLIEIYLRSGEQDPHAIIECKRIAGGNTDLCRQYVINGIDRFRDGKYSGTHNTAFMVGYVLIGTVDAAACGINRHLAYRHRADEHLAPSTLINEPWVRESKHQRNAHGPIELHHAFLPFAGDSRPS